MQYTPADPTAIGMYLACTDDTTSDRSPIGPNQASMADTTTTMYGWQTNQASRPGTTTQPGSRSLCPVHTRRTWSGQATTDMYQADTASMTC
jgi:hypothetical protein